MRDDPTEVERNKERLFEEKIELKWEKGGSGLVFYTDAVYWKQQEGGTSIYYPTTLVDGEYRGSIQGCNNFFILPSQISVYHHTQKNVFQYMISELNF